MPNIQLEAFLFFIYNLELNNSENIYKIGNHKIFSSRWIDLLYSFSVESELLLSLNDITKVIKNKIDKKKPIVII